MSDLVPRPETTPPAVRERADRTAGATVYGLYLVAPLLLGLPAVAGMLMAASRKDRADPVTASHFRFQVWTFWAAVGAGFTGLLWFMLGGVGTLSPASSDSGWLAFAGFGLWVAAGLGYVAATIYGLSRLASRSPIGRLFRR